MGSKVIKHTATPEVEPAEIETFAASKTLHHPHVGAQLPVINCKMTPVRGRQSRRRQRCTDHGFEIHVPCEAALLFPNDVRHPCQVDEKKDGARFGFARGKDPLSIGRPNHALKLFQPCTRNCCGGRPSKCRMSICPSEYRTM